MRLGTAVEAGMRKVLGDWTGLGGEAWSFPTWRNDAGSQKGEQAGQGRGCQIPF